MTTTTDKIATLESLYGIDPSLFVNGGEYLAEWYGWYEHAIILSNLYSTGYFAITDKGVEHIDNAYADWLLLTTNNDYDWDWSEFFPFSEWHKPKGVISV